MGTKNNQETTWTDRLDASVTVNSAPPDTNGAVGNRQYVQMVNSALAVFNNRADAVSKGQVLVRIDPAPARADLLRRLGRPEEAAAARVRAGDRDL